jgi:hypothetical protein
MNLAPKMILKYPMNPYISRELLDYSNYSKPAENAKLEEMPPKLGQNKAKKWLNFETLHSTLT